MSDVIGVGTRVRLKHDPRHEGRVLFALETAVRVRWDETGWLSDEPKNNLEVIEQPECPLCQAGIPLRVGGRRAPA